MEELSGSRSVIKKLKNRFSTEDENQEALERIKIQSRTIMQQKAQIAKLEEKLRNFETDLLSSTH